METIRLCFIKEDNVVGVCKEDYTSVVYQMHIYAGMIMYMIHSDKTGVGHPQFLLPVPIKCRKYRRDTDIIINVWYYNPCQVIVLDTPVLREKYMKISQSILKERGIV